MFGLFFSISNSQKIFNVCNVYTSPLEFYAHVGEGHTIDLITFGSGVVYHLFTYFVSSA